MTGNLRTWRLKPVNAARLIDQLRPFFGLIWLQDNNTPVLALCPVWHIRAVDQNSCVLTEQSFCETPTFRTLFLPFDVAVRQFWAQSLAEIPPTSFTKTEIPPAPFMKGGVPSFSKGGLGRIEGFRGGLMGFIGYDVAKGGKIPPAPFTKGGVPSFSKGGLGEIIPPPNLPPLGGGTKSLKLESPFPFEGKAGKGCGETEGFRGGLMGFIGYDVAKGGKIPPAPFTKGGVPSFSKGGLGEIIPPPNLPPLGGGTKSLKLESPFPFEVSRIRRKTKRSVVAGKGCLAGTKSTPPLPTSPRGEEELKAGACLGDYRIFLRQQPDGGWLLHCPTDPQYDHIYQRIIAACNAISLVPAAPPHFCLQQGFRPRWQYADYAQAFHRVQDYLKAGDCYQINLTQAFDAQADGALLALLPQLLALTQAPYAGYVQIDDAQEILSCSPELFLSFEHGGEVVTRPIKGTQPRSSNPTEDAAAQARLQLSEKDQSENLMIVDLLRNDLAKYAQLGSVRVPKLFEVESFAQVHHLVSEIRATLAEGVSALDVLFDALPGGSITGAPKIRAMQIIDELEAGSRGAYCGSMGYLNLDGTGRFNILIRTLQRHGQHIEAWAGGGVTIASTVEQEYQECWDKIGAILACVQGHTEP